MSHLLIKLIFLNMTNNILITVFAFLLLSTINVFPISDTISEVSGAIPDTFTTESTNDSLPTLKKAVKNTLNDLPQETSLSTADKDSIQQDSIQKAEQRDLYLKTNTFYTTIYQQYPETIDSLYDPLIIHPFQIFQADGMNLFEIIHSNPSFITVPVALASNLNRFLFYGLPAGHVSIYPDYSLFEHYIDPTVGHNLFSAAETKNIYFAAPGKIFYSLQPSDLVKGETGILWESGVFKENTLNIRFARPLAKNVQVGIFSNYQHFKRDDYFHGAGIYSFYRPIYEQIGLDSSYVSGSGINPLTNEHVSSVRISWKARNGTETRLSYKYADLHNDLAAEYFHKNPVTDIPDTFWLAWEKRSHYGHSVCATVNSFPVTQKIKIDAETFLQKNVNRITPLSTGYDLKRGENLVTGGAVMPCYVLSDDDTFSIKFSTQRDERFRYNKSKWVTHYTRSALTYIHHYAVNKISGSLGGSFGYAFVKLNDKLEYIPLGNIYLSGTIANQNIRIFALQDLLNPTVPYDTLFPIRPGDLADRYQSIGAEGFFRYKKAGLILGTCLTFNVDSSSVKKAWPCGIAPYEEPNWVFMVTPLFGRWYGLSLSSQWLFSEKKPYVKSKNMLSYHINRKGKATHVFLDLGFDYWSKRDSVSLTYAGIDTWHRPILDLHLKTAVQIKTFRIFYKVDNLFNSNFAYVPGYRMPGLIFRWGFNWLIQG